ncbi:MAG: PEGA domain-containing protein [Deltaproteobacteria bacterium]|nr:MAG: PEGA domain-containing protein [Deltaproteobacteria bacterium]
MMLAVVAIAASPRRGHADDGSVVIGGAAEDRDRSVVGAAVIAMAREAGWAVSRDPLPTLDVDRLLECSDPVRPWACVPASLGSRGIGRIFVFAVDRRQTASGAPMVVLTAKLIVRAPPALAVRQRFCEHCADDRLTHASTELARQLLQDLAVRSGRTVLDVTSLPPGARITLDGQPIGATDATFNTFPGAHTVVIEKSGYLAETRSVIAEEGKTAAVAVALVPADHPAEVGARRALRGALIGGGALGVIAGGVLLELGSRGGPHDRYRYAGATPAGALLGVAGTAALVAGFYTWWHAPAPSAPSLGITRGAVVAGWITAF